MRRTVGAHLWDEIRAICVFWLRFQHHLLCFKNCLYRRHLILALYSFCLSHCLIPAIAIETLWQDFPLSRCRRSYRFTSFCTIYKLPQKACCDCIYMQDFGIAISLYFVNTGMTQEVGVACFVSLSKYFEAGKVLSDDKTWKEKMSIEQCRKDDVAKIKHVLNVEVRHKTWKQLKISWSFDRCGGFDEGGTNTKALGYALLYFSYFSSNNIPNRTWPYIQTCLMQKLCLLHSIDFVLMDRLETGYPLSPSCSPSTVPLSLGPPSWTSLVRFVSSLMQTSLTWKGFILEFHGGLFQKSTQVWRPALKRTHTHRVDWCTTPPKIKRSPNNNEVFQKSRILWGSQPSFRVRRWVFGKF